MRVPLRRAALPRTLALALVLGAAACADAPTASRTASPPRRDGATAVTTLRRPTLISNHIKYRDAGYHPAGGKAGSASLYVQALVGRDGKTEMQVGTDPWGFNYGWGPGSITHLQVKALDSSGKLLATRNHSADLPGGGFATLTYGGLTRGARLQVQGTVTGIDPRRTDVPVVTGTVRFRPNLTVRGVLAPERVREGNSVPISATVAETNGDLGAWSTCRLYVDGTARDWAQGIWVDAGDAVTCLFFTAFYGGGSHHVEVRIEGSSPRDDDPADNAASAEVQVEASNELFYSASVDHFELRDHLFTRSVWSYTDSLGNTSGTESQDERSLDLAQRSVLFNGWSFRGMDRLPRLEIEEETAGASVHAATYEVEPLWSYGFRTCGYGWDGAGAQVNVCTSPEGVGGTEVWYHRWSSRVTYHSSSYSRTWDGGTGEDYSYHYNYDDESASGLPLTPLGGDYTIRVRLVGGESTELSAVATFPLYTSEYGYDDGSPTCWSDSYPWYGVTYELCLGYQYSIRSTFGFDSRGF